MTTARWLVASRYPLHDCGPHRISSLEQSRRYVRCTVDAGGVEVDVVTAHFISPRRALFAAEDDPLLALDAFSAAGRGYGHTWGHSLLPGVSFLRLDHILVSPEIGVAACFVGGGQGSPHRPVIADLYLERRSRS